mmetsp:Transcript_17062/g.50952  ORF Transcript_17062/g.50952 Transcript_17062/m.50952 type:complete len:368 (-) Transcript_17062:651-1754(-)
MLHQGQLDAGGRQHQSQHREHDELHGAQAAGQEAAPVEPRQLEEGGEELVGGCQRQLAQQLHAKHVERRLAALLGGPQGQPGGLSGLPHGHAPLQDVGQIRRQRRRLPQAPGYAVPGGGVDQVGGGPKGGDVLPRQRQGAPHRNVRPLLLLHLHHLDAQSSEAALKAALEHSEGQRRLGHQAGLLQEYAAAPLRRHRVQERRHLVLRAPHVLSCVGVLPGDQPGGGFVPQAGVVAPEVHKQHGLRVVPVAVPLHHRLDAIGGLRRHGGGVSLVLQKLAGRRARRHDDHPGLDRRPAAAGEAGGGPGSLRVHLGDIPCHEGNPRVPARRHQVRPQLAAAHPRVRPPHPHLLAFPEIAQGILPGGVQGM